MLSLTSPRHTSTLPKPVISGYLEQKLAHAVRKLKLAERKLAAADWHERTAARAIADLARTFPQHAPAIGHDGEPTFLD
jgi:hypothetical protein